MAAEGICEPSGAMAPGQWRRRRSKEDVMRTRSVIVVVALSLVAVGVALPASAEVERFESSYTLPLSTFVYQCDAGELVNVTGTETVFAEFLVTPTAHELYKYEATWDAVGVGLISGDAYQVDHSLRFVANGKPPLTPPTSNVLTVIEEISLTSATSNSWTKLLFHRTIAFGEPFETRVAFAKVVDSCSEE